MSKKTKKEQDQEQAADDQATAVGQETQPAEVETVPEETQEPSADPVDEEDQPVTITGQGTVDEEDAGSLGDKQTKETERDRIPETETSLVTDHPVVEHGPRSSTNPPPVDDTPGPKAEKENPYPDFASWHERLQKLYQMNNVTYDEKTDFKTYFDQGLAPWEAFQRLRPKG